ncbi:CRERF-like protein [Mya arenaria]|uniref:CRERF-like protein n=1 Tax=Mya arenaria TaxID=6604 RepID=A0ABY7FKG8_MYAAR|nr:CRERF-like protein [Mya arenaria]
MDRQLSCSDNPVFIHTCGELPLSTDFMETSIYASSPNSLYMYEQEKTDMQSSMGVGTTCCTVVDTASTSDDFDLHTQYEVLQDISNFTMEAQTSGETPRQENSSISSQAGTSRWEVEMKPIKSEIYIKMESSDERQTPTLAELNSTNLDLLEDIDSYINLEMSYRMGAKQEVDLETAPFLSSSAGDKVLTVDIQGQGGGSLSQMLASPPLATTDQPKLVTVIKSEPADNYSQTLDVIFPKSFTPMTPVKPELIVPASKNVSRTSTLSTIKEIDISDFTTLQNLLKRSEPSQARNQRRRTVSESVIMDKKVSPSRKRSCATAGIESMDMKWEEIKQFLEIESRTPTQSPPPRPPPVKTERTRYDSASSVMTLTSNEDEESDSDRDYEDDSDSDLEGGHDLGSLSPGESLIGTKDKQYFWQYNVQSKGPKGTRVKFDMEEDPHVLNDFEDPVFDPSNSTSLTEIGVTVKHGGKARKGDGNDIVPFPKKLCQLGLQLRKINRQINDFIPLVSYPLTLEEKRGRRRTNWHQACRLKKKAQHEANKVKLHGLETEHRKLLTVIRAMRHHTVTRLRAETDNNGDNQTTMTCLLDSLIKTHLGVMIAGNTSEYVNGVIRKVEAGDMTGGLKIHTTRSYPKELHN